MNRRGWGISCAAALLLCGCAAPQSEETVQTVDPAGGGETTVVISSGEVSCEAPADDSEARGQAERLVAAEPRFTADEAHFSFAVHDYETGVLCSYQPADAYETASIIKVATLATLLWQIEQSPDLMFDENLQALAEQAITVSDNDAQEELWQFIGGEAGIREFLDAAGMTDTLTDGEGTWGLTMTTADDQLRLMDGIVNAEVISASDSDYLLGLMRQVDTEQVWGVSEGAPLGALVALKNGWLDDPSDEWVSDPSPEQPADAPTATPGQPDEDEDTTPLDEGEPYEDEPYEDDESYGEQIDPNATWTNNSIGYVSGIDQSYSLVILSDGNATDEQGRAAVGSVSETVAQALIG